jgi:hypothetical protein
MEHRNRQQDFPGLGLAEKKAVWKAMYSQADNPRGQEESVDIVGRQRDYM